MKRKLKRKKEEGQAIVEFAFVLPIFLLLVMGIMDFGFLFYNYISIENAARNAARIACVEYTTCCYNSSSNEPKTASFTIGQSEEGLTDSEKSMLRVVEDSLPAGVIDDSVTISVKYSYDTTYIAKHLDYNVNDRYGEGGDVKVTVTGDARVLTPVLGVTADGMKKEIFASSTFKVERQVTTASP